MNDVINKQFRFTHSIQKDPTRLLSDGDSEPQTFAL